MKMEEIKNAIQRLLKLIENSTVSARKVISACNNINASWSGSDLVGHADYFYENYDIPPNNKRFSIEWGLINGVPEGWCEKDSNEVLQKIENESDVSLKNLDELADSITSEFEKLRKQAIINFSEISKEAALEIEKFNLRTKTDIFNQYWKRQIATRDSEALWAGRKIPTHKYYNATASFLIGASEQLNDFTYLIDKVIAQNKSGKQGSLGNDMSRTAYVDKNTLLRLSKIENGNFDLSRLLSFCNELDDNYSLGNYHSCAMLLRSILDHVPPIFEQNNFADVCAKYGSRSFKDIVKPLNETAKKIGDDYLHSQISKKVLMVTKTQVSFQANLDSLLNEVAAILELKNKEIYNFK